MATTDFSTSRRSEQTTGLADLHRPPSSTQTPPCWFKCACKAVTRLVSASTNFVIRMCVDCRFFTRPWTCNLFLASRNFFAARRKASEVRKTAEVASVKKNRVSLSSKGTKANTYVVHPKLLFPPSLIAWLAGQSTRSLINTQVENRQPSKAGWRFNNPSYSAVTFISGQLLRTRKISFASPGKNRRDVPPTLIVAQPERTTTAKSRHRIRRCPLMYDSTFLLSHRKDQRLMISFWFLCKAAASSAVTVRDTVIRLENLTLLGLLTTLISPEVNLCTNSGNSIVTVFISPSLATWSPGYN